MLTRTVKAGHETRLDVSKYIFSQLSSPPSWDGNTASEEMMAQRESGEEGDLWSFYNFQKPALTCRVSRHNLIKV